MSVTFDPNSHVHLGPDANIAARWEQLDGGQGVLGEQTGPVQPSHDGKGYFQIFANGSIYWNPETGASEVHGAIRDLWTSLGAETGFLGYPLTNETSAPDNHGRFNHFQGGSIYWTPETGAHEVHGAIRVMWASLGWERSSLGYPLSNEISSSDAGGSGRYSTFQNGTIFWTPSSGAQIIEGAVPNVLDYDWGSITFSSGIAAGGHSHLTLSRDGSVNFTGAMHDSGALAYNYSIAAVVKDVTNTVYSVAHTGSIAGTFESGSRDDPWDINTTNPTVAQNWLSLVAAASGTPQATWSAAVSTDINALLGTILSAVGTVATVVALIVAVA